MIEKNIAREGSFKYAIQNATDIQKDLNHITFDTKKWRDCFTKDDKILRLGFLKAFYFHDELMKDIWNYGQMMMQMPLFTSAIFAGEFGQAGKNLGDLFKLASKIKIEDKKDEDLMKLSGWRCFKSFFVDLMFSGKMNKVVSLDESFIPKFDFFNSLLNIKDVIKSSRDKCMSEDADL